MSWEVLMFSIAILLFIVLALDIWNPLAYFKEGFMTGSGDNTFLEAYFPRRGDISFQDDEETYKKYNIQSLVKKAKPSFKASEFEMVLPENNEFSISFESFN